jgi:hypothetical protein
MIYRHESADFGCRCVFVEYRCVRGAGVFSLTTGGSGGGAGAWRCINPKPYILNPKPQTLHPTP